MDRAYYRAYNHFFISIGTSMNSGEEVGVKLVSHPDRHLSFETGSPLSNVCLIDALSIHRQEPVKARHPQLLYESKLYKILQGGGANPPKLP